MMMHCRDNMMMCETGMAAMCMSMMRCAVNEGLFRKS